MEYFDIVDEDDNVVGTASRRDCHGRPKLRHRAVFVFVFNREKRIFVQKRGMNCDSSAGKYDASVGGHVTAGHGYDETAFRETREELGFEPEMLIPLFKFKWGDDQQSEFIKVYFCFHVGEIRPNPDELDGGEFWDVEELKKSMEKEKENFTTPFKMAFEKYYREFWYETERNGTDEGSGHAGRKEGR